MIYKPADSVNGIPAAFYRDPEVIKSDIRRVCASINAINEKLNAREVFAEAMSDDVVSYAAALGELVKFSEEALASISELESTLDGLREELIEAISYTRI